ncbi:MAG: group II truncated hemoglobin [Gammaproteobacteria bacterium]|nr:group II truncated hemoglobin [Gammaproteobacteria bacterium]NIR83851.1 group II truncated hemoglobin [Gammaproteobacteria bacterium]NIU04151.1 group II truncated hemoglobin [Gammaproteobacteria bacterium]NIX85425.1 hypothetical protein [Gammaproteobacteria bacterium]
MSEATPYELIGGEAGVRELVDRFYDLMDRRPEAAPIRALHPQDLTGSREKLFLFLSGWLGGPPLYEERHGHPRLRMRHLPFSIGKAERDQWLACMEAAMDQMAVPGEVRPALSRAFAQMADHMRNRPED